MLVIDGWQRLTIFMFLLRALFIINIDNMKAPRSKRIKKDIEKCIW